MNVRIQSVGLRRGGTFLAALLVGASLGMIVDQGALTLPVAGTVSSVVVGAVGLTAGVGLYAGIPNDGGCGCGGDCGC